MISQSNCKKAGQDEYFLDDTSSVKFVCKEISQSLKRNQYGIRTVLFCFDKSLVLYRIISFLHFLYENIVHQSDKSFKFPITDSFDWPKGNI